MELLGVALVYCGGAAFAAGLVGAVWCGIRSRPDRKALRRTGAGLALLLAGFLLPARETRVLTPTTQHDRYAPVYQFHEVHEIEIAAPQGRVYQAVHEVTAGEIPLFQALTWIRRLGRPGPESVLQAPAERPILDVATRTTFVSLDGQPGNGQPGREVVVGTIVLAPPGVPRVRTSTAFAALDQPGYAKATMNFLVDEVRPGVCTLRTETRVYATDPWSRRRFAAYWRLIYPGSALIRRMWLRAIRARAMG